MFERNKSATAQGQELIDEWTKLDTCLAGWLLALDDFDTWGTWAEDGHTSCVSWLRDRCRMARATATDKVRVARQLGRRKVLADAFVSGELTYSQVRCLTRVEGVDDERDRMFLDVASGANIAQLEHFVRHQRRIADQDRPPADLEDKRGLYRQPGFGDGMDRVIIEAPAEDIERLMNLLDTYLDWLYRHPESSVKTPEAEPQPKPGIRTRRVDALLDLLEHAAYEHHDTIDIERAAIGVTVDYDSLVERAPGAARTLIGHGRHRRSRPPPRLRRRHPPPHHPRPIRDPRRRPQNPPLDRRAAPRHQSPPRPPLRLT